MSEADLKQQLELFRNYLRSIDAASTSPQLKQVQAWLEKFPRELTDEERREISLLIETAFHLPGIEYEAPTAPFEPLVPGIGWLRDYYEYTLRSEPPTVFHFMSALTVLGASLERDVYFDKAFYRVYPNIASVLIAPTGRCRKTSATNVALGLARAVGVNVLSERITPEALVLGLGGRETASGLVYAPELAVFLGRQKYLEGMVPLLTSLFDCPDTWSSRTIGRGEAHLAHVALSFLGASTLEWFVEALPREAFSGGFMSRLLFVIQEDTDREFAIPVRGSGTAWEKLREDLEDIRDLRGEVILEPEALTWYEAWYSRHRKMPTLDEKFAGYHERKPDHVLRMSMLLRIAATRSLTIRIKDLERSIAILDWMEASLPHVFESVTGTPVGTAGQRILRQLRDSGGKLQHSLLLRKNQYALTARQFREIIETLLESECIKEIRTNVEHAYQIIEVKK